MGAINEAARAAAERYCAEGWRIVPIPFRSKRPVDENWPDTIYDPDEVTGNVGVILGPPSRNLVDVDLDSYWALRLAPYFLPPTVTFGRASKRASHALYYCEGIRNRKLTFAASAAARASAKAVELVELRSQNASNDRSAQTVFPGSVHESGEPIEWDDSAPDDVAHIGRGDLIWRVTRLTVASIIADGWEPGTQRNNKCRAWAGGLLQQHWTAAEVRELFDAVFDVAEVEDDQRVKDASAVERTILAFESGTSITGFGSLVSEGLVDAAVVRRVEHHARTPDTLARELKMAGTVGGKDIAERLLREAQDTDKLGRVADEIAEAIIARDAAASPVDENDTALGRIADITTDIEPLDYIIEALGIAPGKITGLLGFPGTAKGPLLNLLLLCVASGRDFCGHRVQRRRVALVDFETGKLVETRLKRLARYLWADKAQAMLRELQAGNWFTLIHGKPPVTADYLAALETALDPNMLIGLDSYTSAVPGDQNDSSIADVAFALGAMSLRKNACFVVTMHNRKEQRGSDNSSLEMLSGHNALAAALQTAITLTRPDAKNKHLIELRSARAPEDNFAPFKIEWRDLPDPNGRDSVGGRVKAAKWGLALHVVDERPPEPAASQETLATATAKAELEIVAYMRSFAAQRKEAWSALTRGKSSALRDVHELAIRNLVKRGALLADFHWNTSTTGAKRNVWLPGAGREIGIVQT